MSELTLTKEYPTNYSADAIAVLDAMSFTDGRAVKLLGSMSLRSQQYAGDFDAYEVVQLNEATEEKALTKLAARFKQMIKNLRGMKDVYIGDCKAGSVEEWRVIPKEAGVVDGKLTNFNAMRSLKKVRQLQTDGVITDNEAKSAEEMLSGEMTPIKFLIAKSKLKFHIVRWSVPEILQGSKVLRDKRRFTLEDAFSSPTIAKLDTIALVQNNRYTDFSIIYEFRNKDKVLNPDKINIVQSVKENILYYEHENNPFKVLKRKFTLAKFENDIPTLEKLTPVLNSDLGRIYHIVGDIGTLQSLLEDHKNAPLKTIRYELDQFKNRMANVYTLPEFLRKEHDFLGDIEAMKKMTRKDQLLQRLRTMDNELSRILADGTRKLVGGALELSDTFIWNLKSKTTGNPLPPGTKQSIAKKLEGELRDLAHFYRIRNPTLSLGYRVIADDIYQGIPTLFGNPKRGLDPSYVGQQKDMAKKTIAQGQLALDRAKIQPVLTMVKALPQTDQRTNLQNVPATAPERLWNVPITTDDDAINFLRENLWVGSRYKPQFY